MNYRSIILIVLTITTVLQMYCANPHGFDSHPATLVNILVVSSHVDGSEDEEYTSLSLTPEFHPESTSYSITLDTWSVFGIRPLVSSTGSTILVTLDGDKISTTEWNDKNHYFTCEYESGKNVRNIEIMVVSKDEYDKRLYTIEVHYDWKKAYLANIITVSGLRNIVNYDDYKDVSLTPAFHPESTSYSITLDTLSVLGITPVPVFSEATCSITLDGKELSATSWNDTDSVFLYKYESGQNGRKIEINVTTDEENDVRKYTIEVLFNEVVTDIDGNIYHTVRIGNQVWMVENMKVTRFNDGTPIPNIIDDSEWVLAGGPKYCWFDNDISNKDLNGALYNRPAACSGKLAPEGWHVPTEKEWTELEEYLITNGHNYDGTMTGNKIAKSLASTTGWDISSVEGAPGNNPESNNSSGFSAVPAGSRWFVNGEFFDDQSVTWWLTTCNQYSAVSFPIGRHLKYNSVEVIYADILQPSYGCSVRCLKD